MIREFSIIDYFTLVISTYQNELFRCGKNSYFKNIEGLEEIAHDIIHLDVRKIFLKTNISYPLCVTELN